ncbi:uncharacterized protein LOC110992620 isoform X2 [Pieris rapae]|uniref:uncharacterized protein LOC110992620 isoform X2 n=1 Tax=Pieris rapae TaxID=64459 RepID=UPI001E28060D|nr:uncharacterized protein LOC110992620 isoform X2 [Pieris rapae]
MSFNLNQSHELNFLSYNFKQSANALMSIIGDINTDTSVSQQPSQFHDELSTPVSESSTNMNATQSKISYSHISQNVQTPSQNVQTQSKNVQTQSQNVQTHSQNVKKTTQMGINSMHDVSKIVTQCNNGWRVLLLMRGPPGCGKTHLAHEILQMTVACTQIKDLNTHLLSTDDYFMLRGVYRFDKYKLQDAHLWNQCRAFRAMTGGISPIIIDNTNIEPWEMEPYVRAGVCNGYFIHVVYPKTRWARNPYQLFKRNSHNVPVHTIKRMVDNMREGITGEEMMKSLGLNYSAELTPPVFRQHPELPPTVATVPSTRCPESEFNNGNQQNQILRNDCSNITTSAPDSHSIENRVLESEEKLSDPLDINCHIEETRANNSSNLKTEAPAPSDVHSTDCVDIEKRIEEIEKLEQEWDNGENWDETKKLAVLNAEKPTTSSPGIVEISTSKPQRTRQIEKSPKVVSDQLVIPAVHSNDWSRFLTLDTQTPPEIVIEDTLTPETTSRSTCIEPGDMDFSQMKNHHKVISGIPWDINIFTIAKKEKIPIKRMLDKSTTTSNEIISMEPFRCQNAEQHFKAFRRMFSNIPSTQLRDIFENCCGDVNWAVEIVIDGMTNNQFRSIQEEALSDDEEDAENAWQCECLAAYNIIPDHRPVIQKTNPVVTKLSAESTPKASPKRTRKDAAVSDASLQLKRQIEENIVFSENHYSEHHLKMKNARNGEPCTSSTSTQDNQQIHSTANEPSTSGLSNNARDEILHSDTSDDDDTGSSCDIVKSININVGMEFIKQLDGIFGREGMKYPENIEPKLDVPVTILNEINALWMESMMHQIEKDSKQSQEMIEQDADFARLLVAKEEEMLLNGKEPEVPDFKEIMDLDFALSLYQKDIAAWRNREPPDLAAKMTREKLYNLFPDVAPDILSELLMAHDNNFRNTVEALLMSTGRSNIVEMKNGVNKFVMEKEMGRKKRLVEEQRKALSEVEWPLLPMEPNLTMADVERYREEANGHLAVREKNYRKAQEYIQRGMLSVASYYSELGAMHTALHEQANSRAANSLVYVNAQRCKNNATIDLHHCRVAEARQSLDLFLDVHIRKLKEINGRNGVTSHTLFFLTGRGKHSPAGPKVKPAVIQRLRQRGLAFYELNLGLLAAKVTANHRLSDEINSRAKPTE